MFYSFINIFRIIEIRNISVYKSIKKNIILITSSLMMISCNEWSKNDKNKYLIECQRAKLDSVFCECSLKRIMNNYSSFENAMNNEMDFLVIFKECKDM